MIEINSILPEIRFLYQNWLDDFGKLMPDFVKARSKQASNHSILITKGWLNIIFFIFRFLPKRRAPKYIFQGLRHYKLIEQLPPSEILILGGRNERRLCKKKGWKFYWVGHLGKSFQLFFWKKEKKYFKDSIRMLIKSFLNDDIDPKYLFLWEDSKPIGLSLSVIFSNIPNIKVICIAHGMFPQYKNKSIPPEGIHCKYNLVWSLSQKKLFETNKKYPTFILGLPYELNIPSSKKYEVILVGHCGRNSDTTEYFYSLYHFSKIFSILQTSDIKVSYRPHPMDDMNFVRTVFSSICTEDKHKMFADSQKIYIGFSSTLLYEAKQHGNLVIKLDDSILTYTVDFEMDREIYPIDYDNLPLVLEELYERKIDTPKKNSKSLKIRFLECLTQINNYDASLA